MAATTAVPPVFYETEGDAAMKLRLAKKIIAWVGSDRFGRKGPCYSWHMVDQAAGRLARTKEGRARTKSIAEIDAALKDLGANQ